eukprot:CAMPEP_0171294298 /NCGR_PEP_ID=MMETSP0816-20121228/2742_1 /TAXON_ID=420281 /ORGANISM="Proboscia inermis, Strain CCAP1064/1" /LENGTH=81 /DNA_ID=CAMNT_0011765985 /DNA_START=918 /DNA_END=1163 /DNA_ORIENTATION=+
MKFDLTAAITVLLPAAAIVTDLSIIVTMGLSIADAERADAKSTQRRDPNPGALVVGVLVSGAAFLRNLTDAKGRADTVPMR